MRKIPIVGFMCLHNEEDFMRESIFSVMDFLDELIIVEGAWGENIAVNGEPRSTDRTLEYIKELQDYPFHNKLRFYQHNEATQLIQRNKFFTYAPEDCWLWIIDADEVYEPQEVVRLIQLLEETQDEGIKIRSLTFINDAETYSTIGFPRCFRIKPGHRYTFSAPNDLLKDGRKVPVVKHEYVRFFHYSYCHKPDRFTEKKRERTHLHGSFAWSLNEEGKVTRPDAKIEKFTGIHPPIMSGHKLITGKIPDDEREAIVMVQHSGIGNLIHTTPALKALRKLKPDARVLLLTWPRSSRILEDWPVLDQVWTGDPNQFLRDLKCSYCHLLISPVGNLLSQNGKDAAARRGKVYSAKVGPVWGKHEAEYHMDLVRQMGYRGPTPDSEIYVGDENYDKIDEMLEALGITKNFVVINASYLKDSHWYLKHWGNAKYAELIKLITVELKFPIVFVGAKADKDDAQQIIAQATKIGGNKSLMIDACDMSSDIKDTAALIARSRIIIGNDGGLQHVAAALGIPTVTVFTFTNPIKNAPRGEKSRSIMKPCQHRISCQHGKFDKCGGNGCLDVPVSLVWRAVSEVLGGEEKAQK